MNKNIIKEYINKINKNDIIKFAHKQNIFLENDEIDYIYNTIKKDYNTFLYDNPNIILNKLKSNLKPTTYQKIENLYNQYKNKFN